MPVSTFTQPNYTSDTGTTYPSNIDAAIKVLSEIGQDFAPHQAATPNLTVLIDAGKIIKADGTLVSQAQQTATFVAPVTNPRIDRIVIDMLTGAYSIIAGTEAASPTAPAIPAGKLPCAQVSLTVGITQITNALFTDERTAYCQYKANPAQMESGALAAGVTFPATQLGAGAIPAGVTLPATQLTTGAVPSGVTLPASQITAGTMSAGTVPLARMQRATGYDSASGSINLGTVVAEDRLLVTVGVNYTVTGTGGNVILGVAATGTATLEDFDSASSRLVSSSSYPGITATNIPMSVTGIIKVTGGGTLAVSASTIGSGTTGLSIGTTYISAVLLNNG